MFKAAKLRSWLGAQYLRCRPQTTDHTRESPVPTNCWLYMISYGTDTLRTGGGQGKLSSGLSKRLYFPSSKPLWRSAPKDREITCKR